MASGKKKHIERKDIRRKFWFPVTDKERSDYGMSAAKLEFEIQKEEEKVVDLKEKIKAHNAVMKEAEKERRRILNAIQTKKEQREVDAIEIKDFDKKVIRYQVGKEILEERAMTAEETQMSINVDEKKKREKALTDDKKQSTAEQKLRKQAEDFKNKRNGKAGKASMAAARA